ncbi:hypothetical protein [Proteiniphilum sp. X52]|uniref:hypothetical protein n=1 Tax=Proteiniphilum sp. X52 TaxID=2382159 RepID=UPI000F0A0825|nr:hypothetical protein [Proteiniphilum sp. X52]RNC65696.1 hypothetical protein D7D25_06005 [Proteiniphilum sp. X52]
MSESKQEGMIPAENRSGSGYDPEKPKHLGGVSFAKVQTGVYAITGLDTEYTFYAPSSKFTGPWEQEKVIYGGVEMVPYGYNNNMPAEMRDLLEKNNLAPGILSRKLGLQYGQGPFLYSLKLENNEIRKEWTEDKEIQAWLDSWDYRQYVRDALIEFNHSGGFFARYHSARSRRLGKPWISRIKALHSTDCRMGYPGKDKSLDDVDTFYIGNFESNYPKELEKYARFNMQDPGRYPVCMDYHSLRSWGHKYYSVASFLGAVPWVKRANDLPEIIQYLTENMIAAAYHVHVPREYWEEKYDKLVEQYPEESEKEIEIRMQKLRDELTETIAKVLSGKKNTGKFLESIDFTDDQGNRCVWKVEQIEMNIDKFIEAQSKISNIADSSTTSGFGLNPALSNIIIDGKGDSGSQMIYALKIFYAADTQIAEDIVFEPINRAFRINFPGKNIDMGIYRLAVNKENNVSAGDRMTNQI